VEPAGTRGRNDSVATAQRLAAAGRTTVTGRLSPASQAVTRIAPGAEDDGAIPGAETTGIGPARPGIATSGTIGDGPHPGTGDFDFYRVDAAAGATIIARAGATGDTLDPALTLYDDRGRPLAAGDERVNDINPVLVRPVPHGGVYYVMVAGSGSAPADPFDAASGSGASSTGGYTVSIVAAAADVDFYAVPLHRGEVLGAAIHGTPDEVTILDPAGAVVHGSTGDASVQYPAASPLPRGPVSADYVATADGYHYVAVAGTGGAYSLAMTTHRAGLGGTGRVQTLFLDFDGARVDPAIFASSGLPAPNPPGPRDLTPLRSFLPAWGLAPRDLVRLEHAVTATVERDLNAAIATAGRRGHSAVRVRSSADGPDLFGRRDVSRLVLGGTIAATGLPTIGIAQSVDPGNLATEETAVVLLDVLSRPAPEADSIATYLPATGGGHVAYVGEVLGDYLAHEAGHLLGNFHTEPTGGRQGLMDVTDIARIVAGPDALGGTADDVHLAFAASRYLAFEGFTGSEDTAARVAYGLSD
jgi:hypothetical protein